MRLDLGVDLDREPAARPPRAREAETDAGRPAGGRAGRGRARARRARSSGTSSAFRPRRSASRPARSRRPSPAARSRSPPRRAAVPAARRTRRARRRGRAATRARAPPPRRGSARRPTRRPLPRRVALVDVSVVPSSRSPYQGTANVTRTSSCGTVSAAVQSSPPGTRTCAPLLRRTDVPARGSSSRRTTSTHGPAALTTTRAHTSTASPSTRTSAPLTFPVRARSDTTSARLSTVAPGSAAASDVLEAEPRVVRPGVGVERARAKTVGAQRRTSSPARSGFTSQLSRESGEGRVEEDPALDEGGPERATAVEREEEREPVDEVRRDGRVSVRRSWCASRTSRTSPSRR